MPSFSSLAGLLEARLRSVRAAKRTRERSDRAVCHPLDERAVSGR
jgi:hypothetical protein